MRRRMLCSKEEKRWAGQQSQRVGEGGVELQEEQDKEQEQDKAEKQKLAQ